MEHKKTGHTASAAERELRARARVSMLTGAGITLLFALAAIAVVLYANNALSGGGSPSIRTATTGTVAQSSANAPQLDQVFNSLRLDVTAGGTTKTYGVYAAYTIAQQEEGYMNQTSLGDCGGISPCIGMIFFVSSLQLQSPPCFWMENTIIPLKQVWINQNGTVAYVYEAKPLSTSVVCHNGTYVLETSPNQSIGYGDIIRVEG